MAKYHAGRRFEYETLEFWKDCGITGFRSAGSKGAFDLIGFNSQSVFCVQCKSESGKKTSYAKDIARMKSVKTPKYVEKYLLVRKPSGRFIDVVDISDGSSHRFPWTRVRKNAKKDPGVFA